MLEKNTEITNIAIHTLNKNILVSASAGAGKTKLLIDRLIKRIMIDRIDVTKILALTFTEAAASEMKHRLRSEISKKINETNDAFLRTQLSLIETASISTIHSFCLSIIKDYSYVLHLDPEIVNNLLDEATKKSIFDQCLEQVIREAIVLNSPSFKQLVTVLCERSENFDPLKKAILSVYNVRNSKVNPPIWDKHVLSYYQKVKTFKDLPTDLKQLLKEDYLMDLNQLLVPIRMILADDNLNFEEENHHAWKTISTFLMESESLIKQDLLDKANHLIYRAGEVKTKNIKDADKYNKLRKQFNDLLKKQIGKYFSEKTMLEDLSQQEPILEQLLLLGQKLSDAYSYAKETQKVMDYDDMEKYAFAILSNRTFNISKIYQSLYEDVLVDEFQDTNDIQHEIIKEVSRDDNVFRVGDVKQSIYRFRNAKPQLMRDLAATKHPNNILLFLPNNFRSSEDIVQFNNFVFSHLMNIQPFDDRYLENDHVSIGRLQQHSKENPVELHMIDFDLPAEQVAYKDEDDEEENTESVMEYEETTMEGLLKARHIASQMLLYKKQGYQFKDMCVLVRTHKTKSFLKEVFDETNIPYFIDTKSGFYNSQAIQDVLAFFRVLLNFNDEISLTGLSTSAFFQLTFDDLSKIALYKREHGVSLWETYRVIHPKITTLIKEIRSTLNQKSLSEVMQNLYKLNDFYQNHCDEQAKINLDFLYEKSIGFEQKGHHGVTRFLHVIKNVQDEISSEAIPIGSDEDVVKVMTIHQSKGLQFPIVFFWTNNSNVIMDLKEKTIVDSLFGIGMHTYQMPYRYRRKNLIRIAIEFFNVKQELQEQIRLLYVGLTRAEEIMIIVGLKQKETYPYNVDQNMIYKKIGNAGWLDYLFSNHQHPFMKKRVVTPVSSLEILPSKHKLDADLPKSQFETQQPLKQRVLEKPVLDFALSLKPTEQGAMIHLALRKIVESNWSISPEQLSHISLSEQHMSQLYQFINHPLTSTFKAMNAYSELPIIMNYQGEYQKGYIDLLLQSDNENIIIDFKTDAVDESTLINRHREQLHGYHFAIINQYPKQQAKLFIYSLHLAAYFEIET